MPLISFIVIKLWVNKRHIQNAFKHLIKRRFHKYMAVPASDVEDLNEHEENEFGIIVDDNMRRNAIIVDVEVK